METWLIFAILSALTAGVYNFSFKISSEISYNSSLISIYSYIFVTIFSLIYLIVEWIIKGFLFENLFLLIILAWLNALFFFFSILSRIDALRNVHTVIFFPIYKTIWPILITFISLFFFKETLELKEIIWIIIGITIPLLLITKAEWKIQNNLKKWIFLIILTSIFTAISSSFAKGWMSAWFDPILFSLATWIWWFIFSLSTYNLTKNRDKKIYKKEWLIRFSILSWFLHFVSVVTFFYALHWNFAIVFTVNSFSILVPIILSVIFYKEHFSLKKAIVILLSIISILFFI